MTKKPARKRPKYSDDFGLQKFAIRLTAREFVDFDYLAKLSPEERDWLARFSAEFYQNRFKNNSSDLHLKGTSERRDCYSRENSRNRDLWHKADREQLAEEDDKDDE